MWSTVVAFALVLGDLVQISVRGSVLCPSWCPTFGLVLEVKKIVFLRGLGACGLQFGLGSASLEHLAYMMS